jgi:hypothetical protein
MSGRVTWRRAALGLRCLLTAVWLCALVSPLQAEPTSYTPVRWERFVPVAGQALPVPEQWLQDEEAGVAHSLKLPDAVPKAVPFDFTRAWWKSWLPGTPRVALQYFNHLCDTEAGEWIFRKVANVDGLYFARPQGMPSDDFLRDPYGPEAPWVQRHFQLIGDNARDQGGMFVNPPSINYRFVEQPRRDVKWQATIREPYVRLFGYKREMRAAPDGANWSYYKDKTPMQVIGIPQPSAGYGYAWRGLRRDRDREHGIAGGELIIYDRQTREVLAVRRTFAITGKNPRGQGDALWLLAPTCRDTVDSIRFNGIAEFAGRVLLTTEPSSFGRK